MSVVYREKSGGFVLVTVVIMLLVLAAISMMVVSSTNLEVATDAKLYESRNLNYAAESGLEHASWMLNQMSGCSGYQNLASYQLSQINYTATVMPDSGSPVTIESTAQLSGGAVRTAIREGVPVYNQDSMHTLVIQDAAQISDIFIEGENGHHDHNKATNKSLSVSAEPNKLDRVLLHFDLTDVPANVRIESAVLEFELNKNGFVDEIEIHRMLRDWTEAGATWETYNGSDSWDSSGGDFDAQPLGVFSADGTGIKSVDLTPIVSAWTSGQLQNFGVMLLSPESAGGKPNEFGSSDDSPSLLKLTVNYSCECGEPCGIFYNGPAPIAHWQLNDASGLVATDSRGNYPGMLDNGPYWSDAGKIDGSLVFDGLNDRVNVTHDDVLSLTEALTISAWVRNDSLSMSGSYRILSKEESGSNSGYWMAVQAGQLWFGAGGEFFTDGSTLSSGVWHHVAVTFDEMAGEVRMYFDGSETLRQTTATTITTNTDPLYLGANWEDFKYWVGGLDDVRLYDIALSEEEIADVFASTDTGGGASASGLFRDEFNFRNYSGDDGTLDWSTDWLEINESNGPTSGDEQVRPDGFLDYVLRIQDNDGGGEGIQREANLSTCGSAWLSFDYRREGLDNSNDYVMVLMSDDGGSNWTEIGRFEGGGTDFLYQHFSYDISSFMASDTRVALQSSPQLGSSDRLYVDHVTLTCD